MSSEFRATLSHPASAGTLQSNPVTAFWVALAALFVVGLVPRRVAPHHRTTSRLGHLNRRTPHARKRPHSAQVTVTADDPRTDMACVASRDRAARKLAEALASASNSQLGRALRAKARAGRSTHGK